MASTTYTDGTGVVTAAWLNDVNAITYTIFNGITTVPAAGKIFRSNGTNVVASTSTFADTYSTSSLLYSNGANTVQGLTTANSGVLTTSAGGVPQWTTTSPLPFTIGISGGGTGQTTKTAAFDALSPNTTKGDLVVYNGTNNVNQTAGTNGQALHVDSSQTSGLVYIDNPSRQNFIINPNWQIDQINEGALYTVNTTGVQGPDGWSGDTVGTGVFKLRTIIDPDNAALKCLEITCTTADAAPATTSRYEIWTAVEGYDAAALMLGTASAQKMTAQFKFKSNVTGVYGVYFSNSAGNRFYAGTITVGNTSENEYSISLTGDTTGTWLYTNGIGLRMGLVLAAGTNFQGTAGAWGASTVKTTASQVNFMSAITNIAYLKRVQLIPGALVQAYKPADLQRELAKCQRYYEKTYPQGTVPGTGDSLGLVGYVQMTTATATATLILWNYKATKRALPTLTNYSDVTGTSGMVRDRQANADVAVNNYVTAASHAAFYGVLTANIGPITSGHCVANARLS